MKNPFKRFSMDGRYDVKVEKFGGNTRYEVFDEETKETQNLSPKEFRQQFGSNRDAQPKWPKK